MARLSKKSASPIKADVTPLFRNSSFFSQLNATTAISIFAILIAFGLGQYVGGKRSTSPVDESITQVLKKNPNSPAKSVLERAAIEAVLKATGDQWANYFPVQSAKIFTQSLQGRYSGIGIWLRKNASGVLEISSIQKDSPAGKSGIKALDALTDINGTSMDGASVATAIAALRGKPNTTVQLGLIRDQKPYRVAVTRDGVLNGDVTATQIAKETLYIQVANISASVSNDVSVALAKYPHSKGIILDLRDNDGGSIDEAVNLASLFLNEGTIVSYTRKNNTDRVLSSTNTNPDTAPMTILINRSTASSAEAIAGAMQDRNRGVVLGERSYGKGTVQEIITLSDGSLLEVTIGKYRTPAGRVIDGQGINPDLLVPENIELTKALQVLGGLATLDTGSNASNK